MRPAFSKRAEDLSESIEDPDSDRATLFRTYREFALTNRLLAGWRRHYVRLMRPRLRAGAVATMLDIGFGGGDIARLLAAWARRDGLGLEITGIEQETRALEYVATLPSCDGVTYRAASLTDVAHEGRAYDFVISNHVLHHVAGSDVVSFRDQVEELTRRCAIMSDVARSALGYLLFASAAPLVMRNSFSVPDGLISIRRSFTRAEAQAALGPRWRVRSAALFRLVATFEP